MGRDWVDENKRKIVIVFGYKVGLLLFLLFLPISISIRQIGIGFLFITFLYDVISNKRRIDFLVSSENKFILLLFIYFYVNTFLVSINLSESLEDLNNVVWQCFLLYLILHYLLLNKIISKNYIFKILILTVLIQGLDGTYQYIVGQDFIKGIKPWGSRLTASFDTPRVGNFVCLTLPAFFAYYFTGKVLFKKLYLKVIYWVMFLSPFFLLIFSKTRSGWIGFLVFLLVFFVFNIRKYFVYSMLFLAYVLSFFRDEIIQRMSLDAILRDPRFDLWGIGLKLFSKAPFFGHGISTFNEAFQRYGLLPKISSAEIPHPHNIYVQFLAETGIIGLLIFLIAISIRMYSIFRLYLSSKSVLCVIYFAWILSYIANAFSGHSFFRTWWLGIFMVIFAVTKPDDDELSMFWSDKKQ